MRSAKEAVAYAKKIHQIVRYLGICDGNMQEGSFRVDANVSVDPRARRSSGRAPSSRTSTLPLLERAIEYEVDRQIDVIESGGAVVQETRLYDPARDETRAMRSKEEANDYRYFPDPDLLPVELTEDDIAAIVADMPELPDARRERFHERFGLSEYDAGVLTATREMRSTSRPS